MLAPRTELVGLRKEMDRLFDRLWEPTSLEAPPLGEWTPPLDLIDGPTSVTVKIEIPGMELKDVQVTIQDRTLMVRGEKRQEYQDQGAQEYRMERTYGAFSRAIHLPAPVDAKKVEATFKNGLLTIALPKLAGAEGTKVPIRAE